jgi:hypothetical protein
LRAARGGAFALLCLDLLRVWVLAGAAKFKRIVVKPASKPSLKKHFYRAER